MGTLNVRHARSERSARWTTAPKASQTKQHGSAASTKMSASIAACSDASARLSGQSAYRGALNRSRERDGTDAL